MGIERKKKDNVTLVRKYDWVPFVILLIFGVPLGWFLVNCENEEGVVESPRNSFSKSIGYYSVELTYYQHRKRRAYYRHFLPSHNLSDEYIGHLTVDGFRDGGVERPSVIIWVDTRRGISHLKVEGNTYECLEKNRYNGELVPSQKNLALCKEAKVIFDEWYVKFEGQLKKALEIPALDLLPHYLPPVMEGEVNNETR